MHLSGSWAPLSVLVWALQRLRLERKLLTRNDARASTEPLTTCQPGWEPVRPAAIKPWARPTALSGASVCVCICSPNKIDICMHTFLHLQGQIFFSFLAKHLSTFPRAQFLFCFFLFRHNSSMLAPCVDAYLWLFLNLFQCKNGREARSWTSWASRRTGGQELQSIITSGIDTVNTNRFD